MDNKNYYNNYEERYRILHQAGIESWGQSAEDEDLIFTLTKWVEKYNLVGKKVIEFACGEGACGLILSKLGCIYHGVDIAPSAIETTQQLLANYPNARVTLLDMVKETLEDKYDAALDVCGLHMLITDSDRAKYLTNVFSSLKDNSPMLFYNESYRDNAYMGTVKSIHDWYEVMNIDKSPKQRVIKIEEKDIEIAIPILQARPKNKELYIKEMVGVGFIVDEVIINTYQDVQTSANIYVHKPNI
ncbi:class I SAM-dependent methyltransferase [Clostridiaceae bacterium M8S5]|nr:class I SAM-dependent methyltransferase [Clostridiaceae bacterium M8S5]